jgi:hypothetical protein
LTYNSITGTSDAASIGYIDGGLINGTTNFTLSTNTNRLIATVDLPVGVFIFYWNQRIYVPSTNASISYIQMNIGTTALGSDILNSIVDSSTKTQLIGYYRDYLVNYVHSNNRRRFVYLNLRATFTGSLQAVLNTENTLKVVRIA